MIKIIVDCFGGDRCPQAPIDGALAALAANPELYVILTGPAGVLEAELATRTYDASRLEVVDAPEVIGCDEKPTDVVRLKRNSSMMKGIIMLRDRDDIAAMVSVGSTGALVTGALVRYVGHYRYRYRCTQPSASCTHDYSDHHSGYDSYGSQSGSGLRNVASSGYFGYRWSDCIDHPYSCACSYSVLHVPELGYQEGSPQAPQTACFGCFLGREQGSVHSRQDG